MLLLNLSPFPTIETERLTLKQINAEDAPALLELRSDKLVMRYLDRPPAETLEEITKFIDLVTESFHKNEGITWGIFLKNTKLLAGTIGFWRIQKEHFRAEIGYMLQPAWQGKGMMQEALSPILNYGFTYMKLHSVEANVNPLNSASIRLLERNGFIREAYFRENFYYNGQFLDSVIYSLLTKEKSW